MEGQKKSELKRKVQKEGHEEIRIEEERFRNLTEMLPGMVFETDFNGNITFVNKKGAKMLGYTVEELKEKTIWQIFSSPECKNIKTNIENFLSQEKIYPQAYSLIKKDQSLIPVEIHATAIRDEKGKVIGFQGIILDMTLRKEYEDKIRYLSFHDKLTGLYNRAYFEEELQRLDHSRNLPISIIIGDVNNLKMINDTFGHQHGDQLLCSIANVLKSCFRKSDIISRWGGDEFSIILPHTSKEKGIDIISRINKACLRKSTLTLPLSISMGIATKVSPSENINSVVREAEGKMYRYKIIDKQVGDSVLISSLEKALQEKKYETKEYCQDFIDCTLQFGNYLELEKNKLNELKLLATICDIGKIAVSEDIIFKKGWLSEEEWEEIRRHPEIGYRIAKSSPELTNIAEAILYHHEFWNGNGYPHRIKGEDIPLLARIIHIVNAYQAMTHERPYRRAMTKEDAIQELRKGQGSQFDPELTDKFVSMITSPTSSKN
ncbi:MAG: diguanylate cyclase [Atribacterota bacterium]|nr:diguanylate cyclase [Atribacterota bacterium]